MTAFTIFSIPYYLLVFGVIYAFFVMVINAFIAEINVYIVRGDVSMQFIIFWNFALALFAALPVFFIIMISIWAYRRVNEKRDVVSGV